MNKGIVSIGAYIGVFGAGWIAPFAFLFAGLLQQEVTITLNDGTIINPLHIGLLIIFIAVGIIIYGAYVAKGK